MSLHDRLTISVMGLEASFLAMAEVRARVGRALEAAAAEATDLTLRLSRGGARNTQASRRRPCPPHGLP